MEQEIKDLKQLTNDDLLALYSTIQDHINYLNQQVIVPEEEIEEKDESGGDNNE